MTSQDLDLAPEPDLYPLYPSPQSLLELLDGPSALTSDQQRTLVAHSLSKAVLFGDINLLTFLLHSPLTRQHVDLSVKDENGLGLVSQTILGFGPESDRDIEREECIRLLASEGANILSGDTYGWTPLHFAALHAPPTLISFLLVQHASPLVKTRRGLTPLDVICAHEELPERSDVALLLEEAMRAEGWFGNEREQRRERNKRRQEMLLQKSKRRMDEWSRIGRILDLGEHWWGESLVNTGVADKGELSDSEDEDSEDEEPVQYTPPNEYSSMLVFSLSNLQMLVYMLVTNVQPVLRPTSRRAAPANGLYYLTRFACIWCDERWVDELITNAVNAIEEAVHVRNKDFAHLSFWLFNSTLLLHLLRCDNSVNSICDDLEIFELLEDLINAIVVFIIRSVEMRIDPIMDVALLDHSPLAAEFESIQFESEWSFLRSLTPRRKAGPISPPKLPSGGRSPALVPSALQPPSTPTRNPSPSPTPNDKSGFKPFGTLRFRQSGVSSPNPSRDASATRDSTGPTPNTITTLLTAVHTLLSLYGVNPALIIQAYSQIFYWTASEVFNRLISRKKYLCRSRALQIGMNIGVLEEWVSRIGLPKGVTTHFACVRQLLSWLQCLSSISDFPALIDTIQTMKSLNPLQMRRAVKDYRYEVSEGRMTEECNQYLAQIQMDWERHRIKLGVELARKERQHEREEDLPSSSSDEITTDTASGSSEQRHRDEAQRMIDNLFDPEHPKNEWTPMKSPEPLGELLNSRYMLPVILPSDPVLLCAAPGHDALRPPSVYTAGMDALTALPSSPGPKGLNFSSSASLSMLRKESGHSRSSSRASHTSNVSMSSLSSVSRGPMRWRDQSRKVREVDIELLDLIGGVTPTEWNLFGVRFLNTDTMHVGESAGEWAAAEEDGQPPGKDAHPGGQSVLNSPGLEGERPSIIQTAADTIPEDDLFFSKADVRSVSSGTSNRSHLTPYIPRTNAEKRRSMRLARRSSGGDTILPMYDNYPKETTPTIEQPVAGLA